MRAIVFEGDPEEVAGALKALGVSPGTTSSEVSALKDESKNPENDEKDEEGTVRVVTSVTFARKVLIRRGLAPNQKNLLVEIYNAGDVGILGSELVGKLRLTQSQFRGVTGAWGRRVSNTPGYDGKCSFFDWKWDYDANSYRYWLPPAVREAVARELIDRK
jgi:hypothetical protein